MSITDLMLLTTVQVARETAPANDGMGGITGPTTTMTTLNRAAIWQAGNADRYLGDKVAKASTHVLAYPTSYYAWADTDKYVVYDSVTYRVTGRGDEVMNRDEMTVVGLEYIT